MANPSVSSTPDWQTIGGQQNFYDERDCLYPSNLRSEKLGNRGENDVVIFDYSLDPDYLKRADGNPPGEEEATSSGHSSADNDIFFQVSKNGFLESEKFDRIINPAREPRLGIM